MPQLYIKTLTGKTIVLNCENDETILSIKRRLCFNEGIPPQQQRIICAGRQVEDSQCGYDISRRGYDDLQVHLVLRLGEGQSIPVIVYYDDCEISLSISDKNTATISKLKELLENKTGRKLIGIMSSGTSFHLPGEYLITNSFMPDYRGIFHLYPILSGYNNNNNHNNMNMKKVDIRYYLTFPFEKKIKMAIAKKVSARKIKSNFINYLRNNENLVDGDDINVNEISEDNLILSHCGRVLHDDVISVDFCLVHPHFFHCPTPLFIHYSPITSSFSPTAISNNETTVNNNNNNNNNNNDQSSNEKKRIGTNCIICSEKQKGALKNIQDAINAGNVAKVREELPNLLSKIATTERQGWAWGEYPHIDGEINLYKGSTLLHFAVFRTLHSSYCEDGVLIIKELMKWGYNLNDNSSWSGYNSGPRDKRYSTLIARCNEYLNKTYGNALEFARWAVAIKYDHGLEEVEEALNNTKVEEGYHVVPPPTLLNQIIVQLDDRQFNIDIESHFIVKDIKEIMIKQCEGDQIIIEKIKEYKFLHEYKEIEDTTSVVDVCNRTCSLHGGIIGCNEKSFLIPKIRKEISNYFIAHKIGGKSFFVPSSSTGRLIANILAPSGMMNVEIGMLIRGGIPNDGYFGVKTIVGTPKSASNERSITGLPIHKIKLISLPSNEIIEMDQFSFEELYERDQRLAPELILTIYEKGPTFLRLNEESIGPNIGFLYAKEEGLTL